ncbi:MAG: glycosyltransferase [Candidatus Marsarchaeota archaeon]|nr:glycosyltransferase [Candidatus Marsarchaeota archaeon]MCL5413286.1 glycosyltransferase [Candidatus Marsarchaeota archaeon]
MNRYADKVNNPEISVIIPTLNEEKYIIQPLLGLQKQTFKNFETIVVDGGSADDTVRIAKKYAHILIDNGHGPGSGRNKGASIAKGKILVFIDADTRPSPRLLDNYHSIFSDVGVAAATGPILPLEKSPLRIRIGYKIISVFFVKLSIFLRHPAIMGSNFAVNADTFRKVNGFNDKFLTYEDWDLSKKLNGKGRIVYSNGAIVKSSTRRVAAWGISGYFIYYFINMLMYNFLKKSRSNYKNIR